MDATQIAERHLIERYLANQLTDAEADAFEEYVSDHPEIVAQIERVARMKSGLAVLRRRGELTSLLAEAPRPWFRSRLAASVAVVTLTLAAYFGVRMNGADPVFVAASLAELASARPELPLVTARHALLRERAGSPDRLAIPAAGAIELTLAAHATPEVRHTVQVLRLDGDALTEIAVVDRVPARADGALVLYIDSTRIRAGSYLLRVSPEGTTTALEFVALFAGG